MQRLIHIKAILFPVLIFCAASQAQIDSVALPDTIAISTPDSSARQPDQGSAEKKNLSPVAAGVLSAMLPGAGQAYDGKYIKGSVILASEAILGYLIYFRHTLANKEDWIYKDLSASANLIDYVFGTEIYDTILDTVSSVIDTAIDTMYPATFMRMMADTARFERDLNRSVANQATFWFAGCYLYSILDAIEKTGRFESSTKKDPKLAGWLSAIPFLGLGQWYNGKLAKAGVILMTHSSLGYIAFSNHLLLRDCERQLRILNDPKSKEHAEDPDGVYARKWESSRSRAFQDRNTFLWYGLLFYFYGIFDAVVDAHLHDFPARMKLEPDLEPRNNGVRMKISCTF